MNTQRKSNSSNYYLAALIWGLTLFGVLGSKPAKTTHGSYIDLSKFGVTGDGVSDNSELVQKALDGYDTVFIPANFKISVYQTILLHSGNTIIGHDSGTSIIMIDADKFRFDNTWNPAAIINDRRALGNNSDSLNKPNTNISILNLKMELHGEEAKNLNSIVRIANAEGFNVTGCSFLVSSTSGANHNAIIDLHACYSNVEIESNNFNIETNSLKSGGAIWIQNTGKSSSGNVKIERNNFTTSSKDETLAIYSLSKSTVSNVSVTNNDFTISPTTPTNNSALTIFGITDSISVTNNKFNVLSNNKSIDGVIRVGLSNDKENRSRNIKIENNTIEGNLSNSFCIRGYSGDSVQIRHNSLKGNRPDKLQVNQPGNPLLRRGWKVDANQP